MYSRPHSTSATIQILPVFLAVSAVILLVGGTLMDEALASHTVVPPGPVTNLVATPGDSSITLSWKAPEDIGSASSIYYSVIYKEVTANEWKRHTVSIGSNTSTTVSSLTDGSYYEFRVYVRTIVDGTSPWTRTSATAGIPNAPTNLTVSIPSGQAGSSTFKVTLNWDGSTYNGGSELSDYIIQYKKNHSSVWREARDDKSTNTTATVSVRPDASSYDFRVAARNQANTGGWSDTAKAELSLPGTPTNLEVISFDHSLGIVWQVPTDGGPVYEYIIRYAPSGTNAWNAQTVNAKEGGVIELKNLVTGTSYDIQIRASNGKGEGNWATTTGTPKPFEKPIP